MLMAMTNLLQGLKAWLHNFDDLKLIHFVRGGNTLADFMTVTESKCISIVYIMDSLPSELYNQLNLDIRCCGMKKKY